jgi:hypothetical protein
MTEWIPSANMLELPLITAATNLETAIPVSAAIAAKIDFFDYAMMESTSYRLTFLLVRPGIHKANPDDLRPSIDDRPDAIAGPSWPDPAT